MLVSPKLPSSFSAILRKIRRRILPERVFGRRGERRLFFAESRLRRALKSNRSILRKWRLHHFAWPFPVKARQTLRQFEHVTPFWRFFVKEPGHNAVFAAHDDFTADKVCGQFVAFEERDLLDRVEHD